MTLSIHETGLSLFPGTGFADERGGPDALGSKVNLPLDAGTGERGWLAALEAVLPVLAEAFKPDVIVSQHGADAHAWDPLAHLNVTTTAMGQAARLIDGLAHEWSGGRWLATGGGGYEIYRVVPRAWAIVWLAASHAETPSELPAAWRAKWAAEAAGVGGPPLPTTFTDPPNAGLEVGSWQAQADRAAIETAQALLREIQRA
jgi:acetoin utilization protein AcuC